MLANGSAAKLDEAIEIDVMNNDVSSRTATMRALLAVYQSEAAAYRSEVIMRAARDRGVWPFNAERIRLLAAVNHGGLITTDDDSFKGSVINAATTAAQRLLSRKPDEISTVNVTPKKNVAYTVSELRKLQFEQQLDEAIESEGQRVEADEKKAVKVAVAREQSRKRHRDDDEREDRAQKKANKRLEDVR